MASFHQPSCVDRPLDLSSRPHRSSSNDSGPPPSLWPEPAALEAPKAGHDTTANSPALYSDAMISHPETTTSYQRRPVDRRSDPAPCSDGKRYKDWFAYPPQCRPDFETINIAPLEETSIRDPIPVYLEQSAALQSWIDQKNMWRLRLRHSPRYDHLVRCKEACIHTALSMTNHPQIRTQARQDLIHVERAMNSEQEAISKRELPIIRDIGATYAAFVDIRDHEDQASQRRRVDQLLQKPQIQVKQRSQPLSRVEQLLGSDSTNSDGTSEQFLSRSQSFFLGNPPSLIRMSWEEAVAEGIEGLGNTSRMRTKEVKASSSAPHKIAIPEWFHVLLERQQQFSLKGDTFEGKYVALLNFLYEQENELRNRAYAKTHPEDESVNRPKWHGNQYHKPKDGWRRESWRRAGGYWNCRRFSDPNPLEQKCDICEEDEKPAPDPQALRNLILDEIEKAAAEVGEHDKALVIARMQKEMETEQRKSDSPEEPEDFLWMKDIRRDVKTACDSAKNVFPTFRRSSYYPLRGFVEDPQLGLKDT
ncbi:hypothetical protein F5Y15DRAFT_115666 [Xylariaceae sp. FL0016]|nr:hypothetical protein F5Y15DRAFT_115666 [Xylariaceae sp. FL0016]